MNVVYVRSNDMPGDRDPDWTSNGGVFGGG